MDLFGVAISYIFMLKALVITQWVSDNTHFELTLPHNRLKVRPACVNLTQFPRLTNQYTG